MILRLGWAVKGEQKPEETPLDTAGKLILATNGDELENVAEAA
jgi:hypothetical protein